jgi:hypothetical protein
MWCVSWVVAEAEILHWNEWRLPTHGTDPPHGLTPTPHPPKATWRVILPAAPSILLLLVLRLPLRPTLRQELPPAVFQSEV